MIFNVFYDYGVLSKWYGKFMIGEGLMNRPQWQ
jgi:hypothetical protein